MWHGGEYSERTINAIVPAGGSVDCLPCPSSPCYSSTSIRMIAGCASPSETCESASLRTCCGLTFWRAYGEIMTSVSAQLMHCAAPVASYSLLSFLSPVDQLEEYTSWKGSQQMAEVELGLASPPSPESSHVEQIQPPQPGLTTCVAPLAISVTVRDDSSRVLADIDNKRASESTAPGLFLPVSV